MRRSKEKQLAVRIEIDDYKRLERVAEQRGEAVAVIIREALKSYIVLKLGDSPPRHRAA